MEHTLHPTVLLLLCTCCCGSMLTEPLPSCVIGGGVIHGHTDSKVSHKHPFIFSKHQKWAMPQKTRSCRNEYTHNNRSTAGHSIFCVVHVHLLLYKYVYQIGCTSLFHAMKLMVAALHRFHLCTFKMLMK